MPSHSQEFKDSLIKKMMPPYNQSVARLSRESGVSKPTLYNWKKQAIVQGMLLPSQASSQADNWDAKARLTALMETALMNETERGAYCRSKGLYPEQLDHWREGFESSDSPAASRQELAAERKRSKQLAAELLRKDRALAETAALLTLSKKARAIWGDDQD